MADPGSPLLEEDLDPDPLTQFDRWFGEAAAVMAEPEAMALASAGPDGGPSVRMVLLKGRDPSGFVFHTNYGSRKAGELDTNPRAALLFHWAPLGRQVRIEGPVGRTTAAESDRYFASRPRGGQIGAHASRQSRPVASRAVLDAQVAEATDRFGSGEVPRPAGWGGYRLRPDSFEFWQHRPDRLHDRLLYRPSSRGSGWTVVRLQP